MSSSKRVSVSSSKQKGLSESSVDEINLGVGDMNLNTQGNQGWEVYGKKSKNKNTSGKQLLPLNPTPKAWGRPDAVPKYKNAGPGQSSVINWTKPNDPRKHGGSRPQLSPFPAAAVPPALKNWSSIVAASAHSTDGQNEDQHSDDNKAVSEYDDEDNESELLDDSDDDELGSDDFDLEGNEESFEQRKKNSWFKELFHRLDNLTVAEINEAERQWHCPACKGGPGEVFWYTGLQSLVTHAKTKAVRVKLHRELAQLLAEELSQRGTSAIPSGEVYGIWSGPECKDKQIVWPPAVVIMNTGLDRDEEDKGIGMGNGELRNMFSSYAVVKARNSFGPQGHRGMGLLIFEESAKGYFEAERLCKYFSENGTDRHAWEQKRYPLLFLPGGKRLLYGYMAEKKDMDSFNRHSHGKSKLKFEVRSYIEAVVDPMKKMWEENQHLTWYKNKAAKHQMQAKAYEESLTLVSEKHRQTLEENKIVRLKTKMHHEQNKEEMEYQEQFFKDQLQSMYEARVAKEDSFEKMQQEQREMVKQSNDKASSVEDYRHRAEEVAKFIKLQDSEMVKFVEARENLIKTHEEMIAAMTRRYWEEKVELENNFDLQLAKLMDKYTPQKSEQANTDNVQTPYKF